MIAEYVDHFVIATTDVFRAMLNCVPKLGTPQWSVEDDEGLGPFHVSAIVGLSGTIKGTIEMSFPENTALAICNKLVEGDNTHLNADVIDALGEMVNMVSGGAKAKFVGERIDASLPSVIKGKNHTIQHPSGSQSVNIPLESELGNLLVRITINY